MEVTVLTDIKQQYAELSNELASSGIRRYLSDAVDKPNVLGVIKGIKDIRDRVKKESFDVIHAGGAKHGVKVFFATRRLDKKPKTFATIGWLPRSKLGMSVASISYSLFYDKCVALCDNGRNALIKWGVNHDKICVIPLFAPDLEWFEKAKEIKINLDDYNLQGISKPVIFYTASHFPHKGFTYYLAAASKVLKKFDVTFVVGGKGPLTLTLKEQAKRLGISKHVVFTGWISNYHMPYLLSNMADICVSTSLVEQLPSYIMECMAAEKPVVASSVGGVPEIIIDEVNGYLVPPHDYEKTAQCIINLLENPKEAKEMGLAGRKMIENQLNMKSSVLRLMEVYEETIQY